MNFAALQAAFGKGASLKEAPFDASKELKNIDTRFSWVKTYFIDEHDKTLQVADSMYNSVSFQESEVYTEIVDMLGV